jgi:hypothetical protein
VIETECSRRVKTPHHDPQKSEAAGGPHAHKNPPSPRVSSGFKAESPSQTTRQYAVRTSAFVALVEAFADRGKGRNRVIATGAFDRACAPLDAASSRQAWELRPCTSQPRRSGRWLRSTTFPGPRRQTGPRTTLRVQRHHAGRHRARDRDPRLARGYSHHGRGVYAERACLPPKQATCRNLDGLFASLEALPRRGSMTSFWPSCSNTSQMGVSSSSGSTECATCRPSARSLMRIVWREIPSIRDASRWFPFVYSNASVINNRSTSR